MNQKPDDRSIWLKAGPMIVAVAITLSIMAFVSVTILNGLSERLTRVQAEREAVAWAIYIGTSLERIEDIAKGEPPGETELAFLLKVREFGNIFRFKLFDDKGHLRLVSDDLGRRDHDDADLGKHNATAAQVLADGKSFASIHDGTAKPNRPDVYSEAYVPIMKDGRIVAISEVYVDQTHTTQLVRDDFAVFGVIIAGLTLLVLLVPLWALRLLTQELQKRNFDLNVERARAVEAESAKSAFLAHMSHELRTPLNAIQGLSEMMVRGDLGILEHPKYLEYSKDINFSAAHLLKLVNDILDLSKIDAGKFELQETDIDFSIVINEALRIARAWAGSDSLSLTSDVTTGKLVAHADKRAIKQVLLNLLSNAAKATASGGEIRVTASLDELGNGMIIVTDTGCGIPQDELVHILEPFSQLRQPAGVHREGTGLGLSLVKSMVELHDGTVGITSREGEGTTVTVTLPAERMVVARAAE